MKLDPPACRRNCLTAECGWIKPGSFVVCYVISLVEFYVDFYFCTIDYLFQPSCLSFHTSQFHHINSSRCVYDYKIVGGKASVVSFKSLFQPSCLSVIHFSIHESPFHHVNSQRYTISVKQREVKPIYVHRKCLL